MNKAKQSHQDEDSSAPAAINKSWSLDDWIKIGTLGLATVGLWWGMVQYFASTENEQRNQKNAKESEYRKAFWEKRFSFYARATAATSRIASAKNLDSANSDLGEFWSLYWGEMSIVEDKPVAHAMIEFGKKLAKLDGSENDFKDLKNLSYGLALACRHSLQETWQPFDLDLLPEQRPHPHDSK